MLPPHAEPDRGPGTISAFVLRADVVEALEGGPLIIKATLTYQGTDKIAIDQSLIWPNARITPPRGWKDRDRIRVNIGVQHGTQEMTPQESRTELLLVHHEYSSISSGKVTIDVKWPIRAPGKEDKLLAYPSTTIDIDIPPASEENLTRLRKRLEAKLEEARKLAKKEQDLLASPDRPTLPDFSPVVRASREAHEHLVACILETKHRALVPVALGLIEAKSPHSPIYQLLSFVYQFPESADEVHQRLVKLVKDGRWENDLTVFEYWRSDKTKLPERQLADLMASDNVWTNVLTCTTFPKRCDKPWIDGMLKKVEDLQKPLDAKRFASLLRDLDDEQFDVREKANKELVSAGARVRKQVEESLRKPLSAEVKQRLGRVLDTLKRAEPSPRCKRILGYLGNLKTPESRAVLKLLAAGDTDPWLAKEAKSALDRGADAADAKP